MKDNFSISSHYSRLNGITIEKPERMLRIISPSYVLKGKPFKISLVVWDSKCEPVKNSRLEINLQSEPKGVKVQKSYRFVPPHKGYTTIDALIEKPGIFYIHGYTAKGLGFISNPIKCTERPEQWNLYWGEIHGHTTLSGDALKSPDYYYTYGRDIGRLDFCAATDHDNGLSGLRENKGLIVRKRNDRDWKIAKQMVEKYHQDGRFVTFLSYEWTNEGSMYTSNAYGLYRKKEDFSGHYNVLYFDTDEELYTNFMKESINIKKLWNVLKGKKVMTIPHHTAYPSHNDTRCGITPTEYNKDMERLVEVYSMHGDSEYQGCPRPLLKTQYGNFVQDLLGRGYKLGFIAGGDNHLGNPGSRAVNYPRWMQYPPGLTAVYAENLTRESLWDALWNRRCYGTTGVRIVLEFSINGHPMGSTIRISSSDKPRDIKVSVAGTDEIYRVDIVKNNFDIHTVNSQDSPIVDFSYTDTTKAKRNDYYYVRVLQKDGEMAWASPIWVEIGK